MTTTSLPSKHFCTWRLYSVTKLTGKEDLIREYLDKKIPQHVIARLLHVHRLRLFVTFDTAGEVLAALVRCLGVEKVWCIDVEVYDASPDADRTPPI